MYLSVPFVGDARDLNFFPSHGVVVAAGVVDGGAADAYFAASARASADFSSPSFGHFQNVMSLAQSEIPVILNLFYLLISSSIFFLGFFFFFVRYPFFSFPLSLSVYTARQSNDGVPTPPPPKKHGKILQMN